MSNFYGGREGRSFVISKTFSSVKEMVENFKLGPSYTEVRYEEHVMINTPNKSNPENGQVFRRGYDFDSSRKIKTYNKAREGLIEEETFVVEEVPAGGAIYVGTIAGPAGRAPKFRFDSLSNVLAMKRYATIDLKNSSDVISTVSEMQTYLNTLTKEYPENKIPVDKKDTPIWNKKEYAGEEAKSFSKEDNTDDYDWLNYVKLTILKGEDPVDYYFYKDNFNYLEEDSIGWYLLDSPYIVPNDSFNLSNDLIPGVEYGENIKDDESGRIHMNPIHRNEEIKWAYCSIRNENNEDTIAYVGFQIPYTIVEFEAESVSAYENRSNSSHKFNNYNLITNKETKPFYNKWEIKIPKGIKGNGIENIRVIDAAEQEEIFAFQDSENLLDNNGLLVRALYKDAESRKDDIDNHRQILVCDYVCYDALEDGDRATFYLGDFNMLIAESGESAIQLDSDGTLHINFTHDDDIIYDKEKRLNWLTDVSYQNGNLDIKFNNENIDRINTILQYTKDIQISDDGTITLIKANGVDDNGTDKDLREPLERKSQWITEASFDKDSGDLKITFNNQEEAKDLITNIKYAEEIGIENDHLKVDYSDSRGIVDLGSVCYAAAASAGSEALKAKIAPTGLWFVTEGYKVPED